MDQDPEKQIHVTRYPANNFPVLLLGKWAGCIPTARSMLGRAMRYLFVLKECSHETPRSAAYSLHAFPDEP